VTRLKVFLDSNILFSAAYRSPNGFERLWRLDSVILLTSYYCVTEVKRNLATKQQLSLLDNLLPGVELVADCPEEQLPSVVMLPGKDIPVLAAAMLCEADVLVTGDRRHFGPFYGSRQGSVRVESPEMFWSRFPLL
jgi:predicted nucleic acid-binding protein